MTPTPHALDPQLLASIGDLELVARVTVEGTIAGLHGSPFHGYSAEFSQYRHYRPGDDLKYVDWKLFGRSDRIYTKQYRETTNLHAQVVLDASASMQYAAAGGPSKWSYARIVAGALAYLLVMQGDAVGLVAYGEEIRRYVRARGGQAHLRTLLLAMADVEPAGGTRPAEALRRAADLLGRRGLLVVISDLYEEEEAVERELIRAVRMGHEVAVFHVLTRDELEFPFRGDLEIEDLESGRTVLAHAAIVAARYRERMGAFLDRWRARCTGAGIDYTRVLTDMRPDTVLRQHLLRRSASARS